MKEFNEIDQLFQTTLEGFEITPAPSVKENIDRVIAAKKRRKKFLFFLLLVPVIGGAAFLFYPPREILPAHQPVLSSAAKNAVQNNTPEQTALSGSGNQLMHKENDREKASNNHPGTDHHSRKQHNETPHNTATPVSGNDSNPSFITAPGAGSGLLSEHINESDTLSTIQNDSISGTVNTISAENTIESEQLAKKHEKVSRWSIVFYKGWEGGKTKAVEHPDMSDLSNENKESVRIHTSSFYGKAEINRRLTENLSLFTGIGFRSSSVKQSGSLYVKDSTWNGPNDNVSATPVTYVYFLKKLENEQRFLLNSLILPIGAAYSLPITGKLNLRFAGSAICSYGWLREIQLHPALSKPHFRSFGWEILLRPEIHYRFGKFRLIGYGTISHTLSEQLRWETTTAQRPLFGGGIGLWINL